MKIFETKNPNSVGIPSPIYYMYIPMYRPVYLYYIGTYNNMQYAYLYVLCT